MRQELKLPLVEVEPDAGEVFDRFAPFERTRRVFGDAERLERILQLKLGFRIEFKLFNILNCVARLLLTYFRERELLLEVVQDAVDQSFLLKKLIEKVPHWLSEVIVFYINKLAASAHKVCIQRLPKDFRALVAFVHD